MVYRKEEIETANDRATARLARTPTATAAHYDRRVGRVVIDLSTGLSIAFRPQDAQGFEHAKPEQLRKIEISPSGLGLHFPAIDADIYLPGLLEGFLGSRRWMAAQLGKAGGSVTSRAKTAAVRANGKLGGRPKKVHVAAGAGTTAATSVRPLSNRAVRNSAITETLNRSQGRTNSGSKETVRLQQQHR